ncbi:MAG: FKBP-type peptidyl-prolyl cis-trans isomerase [Flavobacteriia bacterium]|jgi:FKBP-type peptidyl-prolyl cis-trans isomerase
MKNGIYIVLLIIMAACGEDEQPKQIDWDQKKSTDFNKELAIEQEMQIKFFLEQHRDWEMEKTGSGLQYYVYEKGEGEQTQPGMKAQVEMEVSLLDGTPCYKTAKDELEEFIVDKSDIETGIQEGIKKLHAGDRAKLIIPSHLAHGLVGDMNKIPPLTVILVDIHLMGLLK